MVTFHITDDIGRKEVNIMLTNTHRIIHINGHYEAYDDNGNFVCSGDTWNECYNDLIDMLVAEARAEMRMENIREETLV